MANNICTAANGVVMKKMLDPKDKSSLGKFGLSKRYLSSTLSSAHVHAQWGSLLARTEEAGAATSHLSLSVTAPQRCGPRSLISTTVP